jgi:hypothetical protein
LTALTTIFLLPGIRLWWRMKAADWSDPSFAAVAAFAIILALYAIDNILNAMLNPVITVCMGAVSAAALRRMTPAPGNPQAVEQQLSLRKSPYRRALWPPQRAPVGAGSQWNAGERPVGPARHAPQGPHWRR